MTSQLNGLDWVVAGAAAVSLYVLGSMWLTSRRAPHTIDRED